MKSREYNLWNDIQQIIGNAKLWPLHIRKLFWLKYPRHFDRLLICTFAWDNGLNPEVLVD